MDDKNVLISIQPKWCGMIANGQKTIEVRKTKPKLQTPFKCYIYCTQSGGNLVYGDVFRGVWCEEYTITYGYSRKEADRIWGVMNGKVIGEFICDKIYEIRKRGIPENFDYCYLSLNEWGNDDIEVEIKAISASCVSKEELNAYGAKAPFLYGWHISDLKIYDTPRELGELRRACPNSLYCERCAMYREYDGNCGNESLQIKRAPQSWCYLTKNTTE